MCHAVYIPPAVPGDTPAQDRDENLRQLARFSKTARLVESADKADLIMIVHWGGEVMRTIDRFPNRCFVLDDSDDIDPILHGIYASGYRAMWRLGRIKTGCFNLYQTWFRNPFVEGHAGDAWRYPKEYLGSFVGRLSHDCRKRLFATRFGRQDMLIRCTDDFDLFKGRDDKRENQRCFVDILEKSKFALCPRGAGASSIRLFEAMELGVAPVIQSDNWILPKGPDWHSFAILVPESDSVEPALLAAETEYREKGKMARAAWERFFSRETYFDYLVRAMNDIKQAQRIPEGIFWRTRPLRAWLKRARRSGARRVAILKSRLSRVGKVATVKRWRRA